MSFKIFIKFNFQSFIFSVEPDYKISIIYHLINSNINYDISNNHIILYNLKILDDDKTFNEYNIINNSSLFINYSLSKQYKLISHDFEGETSYKLLLDKLLNKCGYFEQHTIISLFSYNVCNQNNNKNIIQQLQPKIIQKIINKNLNDTKINILLTDLNFIKFNELLITNNYQYKKNLYDDTVITSQINDYLKLNIDEKFLKLSSKFNNRIIRFKTNLSKLEEIINIKTTNKCKINIYFIGINFNSKLEDNIDQLVIRGFSYLEYKNNKNLYINMWTGEELYNY